MSEDYWTISTGTAINSNHKCRECMKYILKGSTIVTRDGRKIRLFYHQECFSGTSDPRTQPKTIERTKKKYKNCISEHAPKEKGNGKWSVSQYGCKKPSI